MELSTATGAGTVGISTQYYSTTTGTLDVCAKPHFTQLYNLLRTELLQNSTTEFLRGTVFAAYMKVSCLLTCE